MSEPNKEEELNNDKEIKRIAFKDAFGEWPEDVLGNDWYNDIIDYE